ncbi:NADH:ubiquinone reductase (Na(+)-transporting) subunit C [Candidatus Sulfidibacterium hydrothermale]|jgi:Na+-transporting NADH:ubiquinone oxidoreductase subunit C|uniref:NADH:ubiquinone reductase (Na(+)-transporting) subunit C n=1 Tax=Candidatus Sulfidibacterium hydrothermale TaxID=2875962 RepID=UPI001F0B15A6|nr:NADH:ubiquinone reductase (Na(+)-transporting) subunit C [Candidatus Sulfidibacterium hydrothermale]UBM61806.1 NADH:ubiquinone reductase (Na(+)-transporting) subunit C [Candidatus Sulfidibacterium hydrothermale]
MYTNRYIFTYAAILVIVAAALLSLAAMLLKPFQERNRAIDKMRGILSSVQVKNVNAENAIPLFNKYIVEELVLDPKGNILNRYTKSPKEEAPAFKIDLKKENYNKTHHKPYKLPLYIAEKDGQKIYIIPMLGTGLWGPIWGNIALTSDFKRVVGVFFDDKSETPGLGGEIKTPKFENQFIGKTIFDNEGHFTSIEVVKGGVVKLPPDQRIHGVDAISGGTLTSNGVDAMLRNTLKSYLPFMKKHQ